MTTGNGPRAGNAIVPSDWAAFYDETHVPAAVRVDDTLHVTGHTGETASGDHPEGPEAQIRQTFPTSRSRSPRPGRHGRTLCR
jgi:hypothetical protein